MREEVVLVDLQDRDLGLMEKMEAHQKGVLHRAISVFIFNDKKQMLLQQRAANKYHSGGLWTNACCSHPRKNEAVLKAAVRRLQEEMGINCELSFVTTFVYRSEFENGLIEHELDHVFVGFTTEDPNPDPNEAKAFRWINYDDLEKEIEKDPESFTSWFRIALEKIGDQILKVSPPVK